MKNNFLITIFVVLFSIPIRSLDKFNYVERMFPNSTECRLVKQLTAPRDVERWHTSHKTSPKRLSCHLLDSCWFTYILVSAHNEIENDTLDPFKCAVIASFHDYLEVYTGDILSTFKNSNPDAKRICTEEERKAFSDFIETVPEKFKAPLIEVMEIFLKDPKYLTDEEKTILKIIKYADLMSAYNECVEELKAGNEEFSNPSEYLKAKMHDLAKENKSIEYFENQVFSP